MVVMLFGVLWPKVLYGTFWSSMIEPLRVFFNWHWTIWRWFNSSNWTIMRWFNSIKKNPWRFNHWASIGAIKNHRAKNPKKHYHHLRFRLAPSKEGGFPYGTIHIRLNNYNLIVILSSYLMFLRSVNIHFPTPPPPSPSDFQNLVRK